MKTLNRTSICHGVLLLTLSLFTLGCPSTNGSSGGNGDECPEGERIVDGECQPTGGRDAGREDSTSVPDAQADSGDTDSACTSGDRECDGTNRVAICVDGSWAYEDCLEDQQCAEGICVDLSGDCTPGADLGCHDETSYRLCAESGTGYDVFPCPEETPNCLFELGECTDMVCVPGSTRCAEGDDSATETCNEDGSGWDEPVACEGGTTCDGGECLSPCQENAKLDSFLGCDYWAVDLDQAVIPCTSSLQCQAGTCVDDPVLGVRVCDPSGASQEFSVAISNPNDADVTVTIENGDTGDITTETVAAQTVESIPLPRLDLSGTSLSRRAYHVSTDFPVTAHQFNPTNNVDVYSNDASLLLPSNAVGSRYHVLGWPTGVWIQFGEQHALQYVTIIAVEPDVQTTVRITPTVDVAVGVGVNRMVAGSEATVNLDYGDVLHLETYGIDGADLSGTLIDAGYPVVVFTGHECAFIPSEYNIPGEPAGTASWATMYCDHIEQQLVPIEAWGDRYFGVKLHPRGTEDDVWRVVASEDGTTLETNPAIAGVNGETLNAGQVLQFITDQSFEIVGSGPILLGQFMVGSNYGIRSFSNSSTDGSRAIPATCLTGSAIGDPAFMITVPFSQWRDNYIFLSPADYEEDWFTVVVPLTIESLVLDGSPMDTSSMAQIGDTTYGYIYHDVSVPTTAQPHTITGSEPFGLYVYGYDCDVSYAYPGGLNLESEEEVE